MPSLPRRHHCTADRTDRRAEHCARTGFCERHITSKGMVADWVYHDAPGNRTFMVMTTLRPLTKDGFGAKKVAVLGPDGNPIRNASGKIVYELWGWRYRRFQRVSRRMVCLPEPASGAGRSRPSRR